ncbi:MAG: alanine:cation symporter family protein, partial [Muribaculaceae bacterium]|nr:alanine:cation symporter family protein [Muribaculaceae bacterium]
FSTMFSYSYYGQKCTQFLFGTRGIKWYNYYYLVMIVVAAVISLKTMVSLMDIAFALMALCTMPTLIALAPRVMRLLKSKD